MLIQSISSKQTLPSLDILGHAIVDSQRGTPLHLQVRQALRALIDEHFIDGQLFWPEKMIAERLGVSRGTVRQAIGELARDGLLERHHARGSFVHKDKALTSLTTVSLFISQYESDFLKEMLPQVLAAARTNGLRLEVFDTLRGELTSHSYRQIERPSSEQGVILMLEPRPTLTLHNAFHERGYRTVSIEPGVSNYPGPSVGTNQIAAVHIAVDYLSSLGHRRILFLVNEPAEHSSVQAKISAFDAMRREGVVPEGITVLCGTAFQQSSYQTAYDHMPEVWAHRPTAIFTASDPGAWAAMKWLHENSIKIPEDISVLGYEDVAPSKHLNPPLSTIAQPMEKLALEAVDMLVKGRTGHLLLQPTLVARQSTRSL